MCLQTTHSTQFTRYPANRNPQSATRKQCNSHWPSHLPLTLSRCSRAELRPQQQQQRLADSNSCSWGPKTARRGASGYGGYGKQHQTLPRGNLLSALCCTFLSQCCCFFLFGFLNFVYTYTYVNSTTVYLCVCPCVWECVWVRRVCVSARVLASVRVCAWYIWDACVCVRNFCECVYVYVCVCVCTLPFFLLDLPSRWHFLIERALKK